jgi:hypothetical protein
LPGVQELAAGIAAFSPNGMVFFEKRKKLLYIKAKNKGMLSEGRDNKIYID